MRDKVLKYIFLTGVIFIGFLTVHTCSKPLMSNKTLYQSDVLVVHFDRSKDTIKNVVFFDYLYIDQMNNLVKKDGFIVSTKVKKYKYLNSVKKDL
jgi:hypothetical protein